MSITETDKTVYKYTGNESDYTVLINNHMITDIKHTRSNMPLYNHNTTGYQNNIKRINITPASVIEDRKLIKYQLFIAVHKNYKPHGHEEIFNRKIKSQSWEVNSLRFDIGYTTTKCWLYELVFHYDLYNKLIAHNIKLVVFSCRNIEEYYTCDTECECKHALLQYIAHIKHHFVIIYIDVSLSKEKLEHYKERLPVNIIIRTRDVIKKYKYITRAVLPCETIYYAPDIHLHNGNFTTGPFEDNYEIDIKTTNYIITDKFGFEQLLLTPKMFSNYTNFTEYKYEMLDARSSGGSAKYVLVNEKNKPQVPLYIFGDVPTKLCIVTHSDINTDGFVECLSNKVGNITRIIQDEVDTPYAERKIVVYRKK